MNSTDLAALADIHPEHAEGLRALARRLRAEEEARAEREAEMEELYREATAEELASVEGVAAFLQRFDADAIGPDAVGRLLPPVADGLGRLALSSADPTPGRGPIALALNTAKTEISRAIAVSRTTRPELASGYMATALGFLYGVIAGQGAAVGSG